jgi:P2-related tail formation protein
MLLSLLPLASPAWVTPPRSLLPPNATPFEIAAEQAGSTRYIGLQPTAVFEAMDPATIPSSLLPWLAWGLKLEIWDPDWADEYKRWAVANSIKWHYQKGTLAGIEAYLNLVDTDIVAAVVPPARTYLSPSLTAAQRAAYLQGFPQLRVLPYVASALDKYASFTNHAYGLPGAFCGNIYPYDMKPQERYTRTAEIWANGTIQSLTLETINETDVGSVSVEAYDQVSMPPSTSNDFFPGVGFLGACLGTPLQPTSVLLLPVTTDFAFSAARITDQTISPGFGLIDVLPTDVAQEHTAETGQVFLTSGAFLDNACAPPSIAWQYIYQLWYLFDPAYVPQSRNATTFIDWTRLGQPAYTAELQVNIEGHAGSREAWKYVAGFLRPPSETRTQISDTLEAIRLSMSGRDTILVNTTTVRPIQPSDALTVGSVSVGAWTAAPEPLSSLTFPSAGSGAVGLGEFVIGVSAIA